MIKRLHLASIVERTPPSVVRRKALRPTRDVTGMKNTDRCRGTVDESALFGWDTWKLSAQSDLRLQLSGANRVGDRARMAWNCGSRSEVEQVFAPGRTGEGMVGGIQLGK
jgi:hypothetical protein